MDITAKWAEVEEAFDAVSQRIEQLEGQNSDTEKRITDVRHQLKRFLMYDMNGIGFGGGSRDPLELLDKSTAKDFGYAMHDLVTKGFSDRVIGSRKDFTTSGDAGGGFTIPEQIRNMLIDLMASYGKFRSNVTVLPGIGYRTTIPNLVGLPTVYSPGEGKTIATSDLKLSSIGFDPIKLATLTAFSTELEEDSLLSIVQLVMRCLAKALAYTEDACGFIGNGTESYHKLTGCVTALRAVADAVADIAGLYEQATAGGYGDIALADFQNIVALLPEQFDDDAKWFTTKKFYSTVMYTAALSGGATDITAILTSQKTRYFMGYEVVFVPFMPYDPTNAEAHIPVILGDLKSGCFLGEARKMTLETSNHVLFAEDMKAIKATERISVNALAGVGDTTNPGPIVGLVTNPS